MEFRDKQHCCCCIRLSEGVVLVGLLGTSFHAGQLIVQCTHGHTLTPSISVDPLADEVFEPVLIAVHSVGILVNSLLAIGAFKHARYLILPWLILDALLSALVLGLALYYLVLYPDQESTLLLWHSVIMVLCFLILAYYVYVVQEFFHQIQYSRRVLPPPIVIA